MDCKQHLNVNKMNKIKILFTLFIVFTLCNHRQAYSQSGMNVPVTNLFKIHITGGATFPYTDVQASEMGYSAGFGASVAALEYLEIGIDIQKGLLQEGYKVTSLLGGAQYKNNYINTAFILRLMPVKLFGTRHKELREFFNVSIGGGVSLIKSDVENIEPALTSLGRVENYNKSDVMYPIEIAYSVPIYKSYYGKAIFVGINYRYYYSTTDYLDGYKPTVVANEHNDVFSQISFNLAFSF